jgi:hypothetical protein
VSNGVPDQTETHRKEVVICFETQRLDLLADVHQYLPDASRRALICRPADPMYCVNKHDSPSEVVGADQEDQFGVQLQALEMSPGVTGDLMERLLHVYTDTIGSHNLRWDELRTAQSPCEVHHSCSLDERSV